jgi:hypothetical protein
MSEAEKVFGMFHDAITGETNTRELTLEEIEAVRHMSEELKPLPS